MRSKSLLRRFGGLLLAASLVGGMTMVSTTTAQAQHRVHRVHRRVIIVRPIRPFPRFGRFGPYRPFDRYPYYSQYVFSGPQAAESQGYHDGLKTGSKDAHKGKSYNPERSHYFHDAGSGNFGEAYRYGFLRGYRDGFRA
jgi:hypothetical protein